MATLGNNEQTRLFSLYILVGSTVHDFSAMQAATRVLAIQHTTDVVTDFIEI